MEGPQPQEIKQIFKNIFKEEDEEMLQELLGACRQITLSTGQYLFHQGERSEMMYMVLTGRLRVIGEKDGKARILGEITPSEPVGEFAFFTGEPRMADARAIRRSTVLELNPEAYKKLVSGNPSLASSITRMVIGRLRRNAFEQNKSHPPKNIAVLNLHSDFNLDGLRLSMKKSFNALGTPINVFEGSQSALKDADLFFDSIEKEEGINLLLCDDRDKAWAEQTIIYSDLVVVTASFNSDASITALEEQLNLYAQGVMNKKLYLALIHPKEGPLPKNTRRWLEPRQVDLHIHIRENHDRDARRFCRILANKAFGLVLGGGGAKGLAHIGVVKAMMERGIEIDFLGGTSSGALYGIGMCFMDFDMSRIQDQAAKGVSEKLTSNDLTIPLLSIMSGNKFKRHLQQMFESYQFEDMWINCFCVSANYSKANLNIHDSGLVWKRVLASMSIPGVFPPVVIDEELHVDGGVMDNLPIEPMYKYPVDTIFAASLTGVTNHKVYISETPTVWQLFRDIFRKQKKYRLPGIGSILANSMTLNSSNKQAMTKEMVSHYFELNLKGIGMLEDQRWEEIRDKGYHQAIEYLDSEGLGIRD